MSSTLMIGFYTLCKALLKIDMSIESLNRTMLLYVNSQQQKGDGAIQEKWLDNMDVMLKLHWSRSTLQRRRDDGTLPYRKIKGKFYYRETDVNQILERENH